MKSGRTNSNIKKKADVDKLIEAQKKGKGKKKKIDEPAEGAIDITLIDPLKPLIETDSPLEFLLISVSKAVVLHLVIREGRSAWTKLGQDQLDTNTHWR